MSADAEGTDPEDEFYLVFANSRIASEQSLNSNSEMSEYEREFLAHVTSEEATLPIAVQETMHAMQALHQAYDAKTIQDAMTELAELADNEDALHLMEDQRVHEDILEGMKCLLSFLIDQKIPGENKDDNCKSFWLQSFQVGCALLSKLVQLSKRLGKSVVKSEAPTLIMKTMYCHPHELAVQITGLETLGNFASSDLGGKVLLSLDHDVLGHVIVTMTTYQDNADIQKTCCHTLAQLLSADDVEKSKLLKNKEYDLIIQALKKHLKKSEVVIEVCHVIRLLCVTASDKSPFVNDELHQLVVKSMKVNHFSSDTKLWAAGAGLLSTLSTEEKVQRYLVGENFHTDCLTMTIKFLNHPAVQAASFELFSRLAALVFEDTSYCEEWQWLKQVFQALSQHREDPDVQTAALDVLCKLLEFKPHLQCQIGDASEDKQEPIHTLCLGAILIHGNKQTGVFTAACSAIYWIAAANERLQGLLMEKNTHLGIYECMPHHMNNPRALEAACKAIRGFCIFNPETKSAVFSDDRSFNLLVQALTAFYQKHLDLQIEAISVLACLADLEIARHLCIVARVHRKILKSMLLHVDSEILQECALEALAILAAAEGAVQLLNEASTMHQTLETMKNYPNSYGIQKKGLVMMQLLISDLEPENPSFYRVMANVIKHALNAHNDENGVGVQIEGCVAMQLLAEKSDEATHALIDTQTHQCLYNIFERFNDLPSTCTGCSGQCFYIPQPPNNSVYTGLYDLATECLHVLGWVRHQTDRLLLSACQKGLLKVVACLVELGADINVGSGYNTPLGYACQQENEELVQYLLEQGTVNDVETPLKWSLRNHTDNITGMLLRHMGFDKEAGIVSWSGRDLGNISPKWLYPTLLGWRSSDKKMEISHGLVVKVKKSQKKRERRLSQENVEEEQKLGTRMKLRYRPVKEGAKIHLKGLVIPQPPPNASVPLESITSESPPASAALPNRNLKHRRGSLFSFTKKRFSKDVGVSSKFDGLNVETMEPGGRLMKKRFSDTALFQMQRDEDESCSYVYIQWPEEVQEWRRESITGCNVPFSPNDPRQIARDSRPQSSKLPPSTEWSRKAQQHPVFRIRDKRSSVPVVAVEVVETESASDSESSKNAPAKVEQKEGDEDTAAAETDLDTSRDEDEIHQSMSDGLRDRRMRLQRSRTDTIDYIPEKTTEVKVLDLSSNNITDLSILVKDCGNEFYVMFKYIEKLDFSHNKIQEFPEQLFKCLPLLQDLDLKMNNLQTFPIQTLACRKIHSIDISGNEIVDLSPGTIMTVSQSMREIKLSHNRLHTYPMWISEHMPNITRLELGGNKIESLPSEVLKLKQLETLSLSHNYIKSIPECFLKECSQLETLLLTNNEIASLPSEKLAAEHLQRLHTLKLSANNLRTKEPFYIPKFILALPSLKVLDLSNNDLNGLPEPTNWSTNVLRELVINNNNISVLDLGPKDNKKWLPLERLNISKNKLKEIPKSIEGLLNLTSLDFSYNDQISTLPDELGKLSKVWEMPLKGLNLDLDEGVQRGEVKHLIGYLHERLKKAEEYFRIKVMIVGFGGRGKTTLLRSLMKNKQPERSIATVGILVKDWVMKTERKGRTVQYKLSTWDFAGQEEFYSTHQCFLSNRSLFLVVCNITNGPSELDTLKPWLLNIKARAPGCPVIIVGTHKDLLPEDERDERISEMTDLIRDLCSKPGFPKVSDFKCVNGKRDNREIEKLRTTIKSVIEEFKVKGQPVMGQKVPASYIKLESIIEQARGNQKGRFPVIGRPELERMSSELQLDSDELQQAVRFLHESGVLLHYDDASLQLRNLYFIDPEWLCRMFAQVVTVREINPFITDGLMKKNDMYQLFKGRRVGEDVSFTFPTQLIPQYLRLLEKFEIALPINQEELLIPCRLPQERPAFVLPKGYGKEIPVTHRYYEMQSCIPIGFWSRLLTRLLTFTDDMILEMSGDYSNVFRTYWREGIFVHWSEQSYFLIETHHEPLEVIEVSVPATGCGGRILGHIVDHLDALVEEWYPGLTEKDPMGDEAMQIRIPCPLCHEDPHIYSLDELIDQAKLSESISCPNHDTEVSLHLLAPDVMLTDLEPRFHIDHSKFKFMQSREFLLGDGSFGAVYRAEYKHQSVAVKVYNCVGDLSPHKFMRQEVTILRRLQHPSLIQMLGAEIKPMVLVLELAPLGSLGVLLKQGTAPSRGLQHRIATQVAEGLLYLHRYRIIYRDMKPDNVLIFNLSLGVLINAKIADYGISRFAAPYGFSSKEGTPGFRAPEVARGETYEFQADVYSFGITLYTLVTGGHHPFHDLTFRNQLDEAVTRPVQVDPITNKNCPPWPDMEDIIDHCLVQVPEQRLNSQQLFDSINCPETLSLQRVLPVSEGQSIECITIRSHGRNEAEAWIGSGESNGAQLSWFSLSSSNSKVGGNHIKHTRILCMTAVSNSTILVGTQSGTILVYDTWTHLHRHTMTQHSSSVLCLLHYSGAESGVDIVLAGLSNGMLTIYDTSMLQMNPNCDCEVLRLGADTDPIKCMAVRHGKLYVSCGNTIFVLNMESLPLVVEYSWFTEEDSISYSTAISNMVIGKDLYISKRNASIIEMWNIDRKKLNGKIDVTEAVMDLIKKEEEREKEKRKSFYNWTQSDADLTEERRINACKITSLMLQNRNTLWVGTRGGFIVLVDPISSSILHVTHRHERAVRAIVCVKPTSSRRPKKKSSPIDEPVSQTYLATDSPESRYQDSLSLVLTGGGGYRNKCSMKQKRSDDYGFITVWDTNLKHNLKAIKELTEKRKELVNKYSL
ncbi:leucine-rich repeat serine/threonine-protein kinase 2-like isoform X2 [Lineus longissimus]|uniref:leucine-rich repeat serine/threonine-protein kinase 2-like isoform X2 n=1 Tax=Lineus longissimus TaxID=88925 RepID=UPI00315CB41D